MRITDKSGVDGPIATLFSFAFRPLFLLVALHGLLSVPLWIAWWTGRLAVPWQGNPMLVHGHEMAGAFAGAAIGGFLLTAVANWTGRPAVSGWRLALLCAAWVGGRLTLNQPLAYALFDLAYWLGLLALLGNELIRARNRRNYKILALLGVLALADLCFHAAPLHAPALQRQALWAQTWLVIVLIAVIGGRIIPAFTGNWLRRKAGGQLPPEALPPSFSRLDLAALIALVLFAAATLAPVPATLAVPLGAVAALLHAWRLARWQGHRTLEDPLVWMLHLSYAWIPLGLALLALAEAGLAPPTAGLHALGAGAIAGMIVSVSSRAALGHTNRPLQSHPLLTSAIVLLATAALLRIGASLHPATWLLTAAALAWTAGFLCYALRHAPILLGPPARGGP